MRRLGVATHWFTSYDLLTNPEVQHFLTSDEFEFIQWLAAELTLANAKVVRPVEDQGGMPNVNNNRTEGAESIAVSAAASIKDNTVAEVVRHYILVMHFYRLDTDVYCSEKHRRYSCYRAHHPAIWQASS